VYYYGERQVLDMKKTEKIEFTKKDIELLRQEIADNPCDDCSLQRDGSCCGCPSGRDYMAAIKPYKDANILEYAIALKDLLTIQNEIERLCCKRLGIIMALPDALVDLI